MSRREDRERALELLYEAGAKGAHPADVIAALPNLRLRGIMGVPAPAADPARLRREFRALRGCYEACEDAGLTVDTLSMGMSADLELAIAEGSTEVRIGTAIFGEREKPVKAGHS